MSRQKIEINLVEVERLASEGHTDEGIAANLGISRATLTRRKGESDAFEDAIKRGKEKSHTKVSAALFEQATKGNISAIIWYEKTRRGFVEKTEVKQEITGANGGPVRYVEVVPPVMPSIETKEADGK